MIHTYVYTLYHKNTKRPYSSTDRRGKASHFVKIIVCIHYPVKQAVGWSFSQHAQGVRRRLRPTHAAAYRSGTLSSSWQLPPHPRLQYGACFADTHENTTKCLHVLIPCVCICCLSLILIFWVHTRTEMLWNWILLSPLIADTGNIEYWDFSQILNYCFQEVEAVFFLCVLACDAKYIKRRVCFFLMWEDKTLASFHHLSRMNWLLSNVNIGILILIVPCLGLLFPTWSKPHKVFVLEQSRQSGFFRFKASWWGLRTEIQFWVGTKFKNTKN